MVVQSKSVTDLHQWA